MDGHNIKIHVLDRNVFVNANWDILSCGVDFVSLYECNVLCVGLDKKINTQFIKDRCPNLEYILSPTTATDHIDVPNLIKVINLIPSLIPTIRASSEFVIFLILSLLRKSKLIISDNPVRATGNELYEKTVGVLGHGRIGSNVREAMSAMGAKVMCHDSNPSKNFCSKDSVLSYSDIVVVSVTASYDNVDYISAIDFKAMKNNAYFVNISRSFVVNEKDLFDALIEGQIAGAAVDVCSPNSVLLSYAKSNLIITPHVAGSTYESYAKACDFVIDQLERTHHSERSGHCHKC